MTQPIDTSPGPVLVRPERGVSVMVFPTGRFDGHAVRLMYELAVQEVSTPNARLLVDLTGITHVPSAGMGMLVTLRRKCLGVGAQMCIAVPDPQVWASFTVMRLQIVLPLFPTREEAFARFKPPATASGKA